MNLDVRLSINLAKSFFEHDEACTLATPEIGLTLQRHH
jgi:hypothetical protein